MSVETYKRVKRDKDQFISHACISTYRSSNVPIFSPRRTMSLNSKSQDGRSSINVLPTKRTQSSNRPLVRDSEGTDEPQSSIFGHIKSALRNTGKYMWDSLVWPTSPTHIKSGTNSDQQSADFEESVTQKRKSPEYFMAPKKARKLCEVPSVPSNETSNTTRCLNLEQESDKEHALSFSKDPFNWDSWKTTQISPIVNDTNTGTAPYGTTLRIRKRNFRHLSEKNQLTLRNQSGEIEYLKMIFNGEYKVPKIIENEREEQMKLMQGGLSSNKKAKKSIVDLTEKIKNILLENVDRRKSKNDDLIFVKEQKVSPLDRKREEYHIRQLRFDRSLLEFDKEFKSYRQLLEERKHIQDQVRKKKEQTQRKKLIPNISGTQSDAVQQVWKGEENFVLMNKDNLEVTVRDFKTLTPRRWLNDTVIEFFMKFIEKHHERTVAFNSFFYTNLSERGYQSVRRWMKRKKVQIADLDKIFVPINLNQSHWALGMIDIANKRILYVDSLSNGPNAISFAILSDLQKYVIDESGNTMGSDFELLNVPCPQQPNGFDCGIYLCMNTLYLSQDSPLTFDQTDAVKMRIYIGHLILSEKN